MTARGRVRIVLVAAAVSAENAHMRRVEAHPAVLRVLVVAFFGLLAVAACGGGPPTSELTEDNRPETAISGDLNPLAVGDILESIREAGLAVPNPHDVTQRDCPEIGCTNKVETDTVAIMKFPSPGSAQLYAAKTPSHFQIADVVMIFSSQVPTSERPAYEEVAKRTIE